MEIAELYKLYKQSYKVVKDTREDVKDAIYFSLKGASFNGNKYALDAVNSGANYAIIDEEEYLVDDRLILVDDVLKCLQNLSSYHRKQLNIPILALTGSNGKTTTKELIHSVLLKKFNCSATKGNLNNHIGVPLTLLSMTPANDFGVVEMGANHQLEIEELCRIAQPDYGYITNFGRVHLEGFGSYEGVIKGKTEMYQYLRDNNKKAFVNQEDPIQMEKSSGIDRTVFGASDADCHVKFTDADPFVRLVFDQLEINSNLIGVYNYANIAAAVCIGNAMDISAVQIKEAIEEFIPDNNRSQIIQHGSNKVIMDAYNANPNSMEAAILNLASLSDQKKIAILGDMFELGDDAGKEHQRIVDLITELDFKETFLIGEAFAKTDIPNSAIMKFKSYNDFAQAAKLGDTSKSTILIKASRGMALERTLDLL